MSFKRKISLIMAVIFLINCLSVTIVADENNYETEGKEDISATQDSVIDALSTEQAVTVDEENESVISNDNIDIKFELLSDWGSGYSAQITITNNGNQALENWQLDFDFDYGIDNLWNGCLISQDAGKVQVSNAGYNKNLSPGNNVIIGFNGSPGLVNKFPENYVLSYNGGKYSSSVIEDNFTEPTTENSSEATSESYEESAEAESENINTGNTEASGIINNVFDFALFTGNINSDIPLYTGNTYINGDVHSNKGFYFQGNKLELNGMCETVEKINATTSSSLDSYVNVKKENADAREMSHLAEYAYDYLIDKAEIYDNWQNFNSGNVELKNSIVCKQGKENFERNFAVQD